MNEIQANVNYEWIVKVYNNVNSENWVLGNISLSAYRWLKNDCIIRQLIKIKIELNDCMENCTEPERATKHKQVKYTIKDLAGLKLAGHGLCGEN